MRVKRPGVRVRARTGYLAATRDDEAKAKAAATAVAAAKPVDARAEAVKGSLSTLGIFSRERPLRMHVASGYLPSGAATIWGVAEVPAATGRHDWIEGGQADAMLIDSTGRTVLTEHLTIAPGVRSLRFALGSGATLAPGDYQVQIRAKGTAASLGDHGIGASISRGIADRERRSRNASKRHDRQPADAHRRSALPPDRTDQHRSTDDVNRRRHGAVAQPSRTGDADSRHRGDS